MIEAVITIDVDPTIEVGPLTLAWHGIMIAVGIAVGTAVAVRYARRRGLDADQVTTLALLMAVAGIVGSRVFFVLVNNPGTLVRPADWLGTNGFAIYGAVVGGTAAVGIYLWRTGLSLRYLDALAYGFPLGLAVGRIGDVINGEHYGPESTLPWALRHPHPDADVPSALLAYHDGGFYELLLGLALAAVVFALRDRLRRPGMVLWTVLALYGAGRFVMFFYRSDSHELALGLDEAQWVSLAVCAVAVLGAWWTAHRYPWDRDRRGSRAHTTADGAYIQAGR